MSVEKLTAESFEKEVLLSDKPVLIDFFATWCGPCKMLAPIIDELAKEKTDIKVFKVDVDEQGELAGRFGVFSIPTIISFKDGKQYKKAVGYQPKAGLLKLVE
ncbi:MAG: thioredoxin [Clostridia bacterium]|jgi:thioredoxin 1|nr:thioredoxin [Clostridia bacterium]